MSSSRDPSELVLRELELTKKRNRILEAFYADGKITRSTYEYLKKELTKTLVDLEARTKTLTEKEERPSVQLALEDNSKNDYRAITESGREATEPLRVDENFTSRVLSEESEKAEKDQEQFKPGKDIYASGTNSSRAEVESIERALRESCRKEVGPGKGFHFYEDVGKPTGQMALSLEDFAEKVGVIPLVSLEFHQERGDFANWIRDTFNAYSLAATIQKLEERGENLRRKIIEIVEGLEQHYILPCPNCGKEVTPQKTWKMAGRPNKKGKSLQLTLGHYKCPNCEKSFREVLAKEMK